MIQAIMSFLWRAIGVVLSILPRSPFRPFIEDLEVASWVRVVNYFVPVGTMLAIGAAWLVAIGVFYAYQIVLRWSKVVSG